jgi:hypothetical protein
MWVVAHRRAFTLATSRMRGMDPHMAFDKVRRRGLNLDLGPCSGLGAAECAGAAAPPPPAARW